MRTPPPARMFHATILTRAPARPPVPDEVGSATPCVSCSFTGLSTTGLFVALTRLRSRSLTLLKLSPRRSVICHSADFYRNEAPRRLLARKEVDRTGVVLTDDVFPILRPLG